MANSLKIIFAGTPDFAAVSLAALLDSRHQVCAVYSQPDRPAGRGRKLKACPVKQLAIRQEIPVNQPISLKNATEQMRLTEYNADIMVVVAYGLILPKPVLSIPRLGCINIHASLLPRWRGAAPIQRAILAGDRETGITIIQMDEGLDTGDMLMRILCEITERDTAASLHDRLAAMGAAAIVSALDQLCEGPISAEPQDDNLAIYADKIDKAEALVDWQQTAVHIERQVRAFNPWPVSYTLWKGERLRIWKAELVGKSLDNTEQLKPGTIINAGKFGIDVVTGKGIIRLLQVQMPGGRQVMVADFLNAHQLVPGVLLGS